MANHRTQNFTPAENPPRHRFWRTPDGRFVSARVNRRGGISRNCAPTGLIIHLRPISRGECPG